MINQLRNALKTPLHYPNNTTTAPTWLSSNDEANKPIPLIIYNQPNPISFCFHHRDVNHLNRWMLLRLRRGVNWIFPISKEGLTREHRPPQHHQSEQYPYEPSLATPTTPSITTTYDKTIQIWMLSKNIVTNNTCTWQTKFPTTLGGLALAPSTGKGLRNGWDVLPSAQLRTNSPYPSMWWRRSGIFNITTLQRKKCRNPFNRHKILGSEYQKISVTKY